MRRKMYFPNAASGNEWNRMATLSIRFYSLHPWVHCALYKFVIFEIFVVEKNIRNLSNIIITQKNSVNLKHEIDGVFLCDQWKGDSLMARTASRKITPKILWFQMKCLSLPRNQKH